MFFRFQEWQQTNKNTQQQVATYVIIGNNSSSLWVLIEWRLVQYPLITFLKFQSWLQLFVPIMVMGGFWQLKIDLQQNKCTKYMVKLTKNSKKQFLEDQWKGWENPKPAPKWMSQG